MSLKSIIEQEVLSILQKSSVDIDQISLEVPRYEHGDFSTNIAFKLTKKLLRQSFTRFMDRIGSKVVSRMADTSSDAPNAFHKPKRQVYKDYVKDQTEQSESEK